MCKVYIASVHPDTTVDRLESYAGKFGTVLMARVQEVQDGPGGVTSPGSGGDPWHRSQTRWPVLSSVFTLHLRRH